MVWSLSLQYAQMCSTPSWCEGLVHVPVRFHSRQWFRGRPLLFRTPAALKAGRVAGLACKRFDSVMLKRSISLKSLPQLARPDSVQNGSLKGEHSIPVVFRRQAHQRHEVLRHESLLWGRLSGQDVEIAVHEFCCRYILKLLSGKPERNVEMRPFLGVNDAGIVVELTLRLTGVNSSTNVLQRRNVWRLVGGRTGGNQIPSSRLSFKLKEVKL